jgi:hypothetical protein
VHEPITLELAIVPGEHVGKFIAHAFPLVAASSVALRRGMLHSRRNGLVVAFGELVSGR